MDPPKGIYSANIDTKTRTRHPMRLTHAASEGKIRPKVVVFPFLLFLSRTYYEGFLLRRLCHPAYAAYSSAANSFAVRPSGASVAFAYVFE